MGLTEREKTGVRVFALPGFPDPSVHRTRRNSSSVADNSETHFHCARAEALSNIKPPGSIITSDRLEGQNRHREWTVITNGSGGICESSTIAYVFTHFIHLCLSYSKQIFVQPSKWPWIERTHFSGRGRKHGRIEKKWAQLRISSLPSRTHRHSQI